MPKSRPTEEELRARRLRAFGDALDAALAARGVTEKEIGDVVGKAQPTVNNWIKGGNPPTPEVVFTIERHLGLDAGSLSKHLGYVPVDAVAVTVDVVDAVKGDSKLSDDQQDTLIRIYDGFTAPPPPRRA